MNVLVCALLWMFLPTAPPLIEAQSAPYFPPAGTWARTTPTDQRSQQGVEFHILYREARQVPLQARVVVVKVGVDYCSR